MTVLAIEKSERVQRAKGRANRCQSVGTKVTPEEEAALIRMAEAEGKFLSEWVRDILLRSAKEQFPPDALMAEVQALRLILVNALEVLIRGDKMTPEQFKAMLQYVKANKRKAAMDVRSSYTVGGVEQP